MVNPYAKNFLNDQNIRKSIVVKFLSNISNFTTAIKFCFSLIWSFHAVHLFFVCLYTCLYYYFFFGLFDPSFFNWVTYINCKIWKVISHYFLLTFSSYIIFAFSLIDAIGRIWIKSKVKFPSIKFLMMFSFITSCT